MAASSSLLRNLEVSERGSQFVMDLIGSKPGAQLTGGTGVNEHLKGSLPSCGAALSGGAELHLPDPWACRNRAAIPSYLVGYQHGLGAGGLAPPLQGRDRSYAS